MKEENTIQGGIGIAYGNQRKLPAQKDMRTHSRTLTINTLVCTSACIYTATHDTLAAIAFHAPPQESILFGTLASIKPVSWLH
jgi:hypothetical protein